MKALIWALSLTGSGWMFARVLQDKHAPIGLIFLATIWLVGNLYFLGRWAEKESHE